MVFTWINNTAGWHFVFTFSPFSIVRVRLCLRWTSSKLSFWIILVFCDKLGRFYFWSLFKAVQITHRYCISSWVLRIWLMGTEDMTHRYWGYDSWVLHILTGTEDMTHRYCISSRVLRIWLTGTEDMTHRYWGYDSWVLHILTGTEDMTHGYCGYDSQVLHILMGTEDMTHGYWGYDHGYCISSWILRIWLTGTAYPHGYWGYDSQVLRIWLTGTAYPHGYWRYDSQVLRIWLMGTAYPHGYWGYDSQVLMIWLMSNAYPYGYCIPSWVLHIVYTGWYNHSLRPLLHGYVFKSFCFHFVSFSNQSTLDCVFKYVAFSWSFSSFPCKQEVKPWKRIPVTGALGPVTISLRFHLLFTRKRWRWLWKCKPNWIYLKTQGYENGTIWKYIHVTGALAGDKFAIRTSSII